MKRKRGRPLAGDEKLVTVSISLTPTQVELLDDVARNLKMPSASRSLVVRLMLDDMKRRAKRGGAK